MNIILASKSPRRKELLSRIIDTFSIIPANINEDKFSINQVSFQKAKKIAEIYKDDLIISADTIVIIDNVVLGKPKDKFEAKKMLNLLSNRTHEVITYYSLYIFNANYIKNNKVVTKVTFNKLSEEIIDRYIETQSPLDKAGAYGIQDENFHLVKSIDGEKENVIGLPIKELKEDLVFLGIKTK